MKNFNSPEAQSEILINAIDNNDTQKLSTILSTQNNSVDENEAEAYIGYIKEEDQPRKIKLSTIKCKLSIFFCG